MAERVVRWLARWTEAGVIDEATADLILAFEQQRAGSTRLRWPIWLALSLGALMLGAGVMLWALGAAIAYAVPGAWPQLALTAVLTPAWLLGEWSVATSRDFFWSGNRVAACGVLLALSTAGCADEKDRRESDGNRAAHGTHAYPSYAGMRYQ